VNKPLLVTIIACLGVALFPARASYPESGKKVGATEKKILHEIIREIE